MISAIALYPAFDVSMNEMAMVWRHVSTAFPVHCAVMAHTYDGDKAMTSAPGTESLGRLEVHRFPSFDEVDQIIDVARERHPDVIFCAVKENFPLARRIGRVTGAPIVLHTEFFLDDTVFLNRRYYLGIRAARPFLSSQWRSYLHSRSRLILASNPQEFLGNAAKRYPRLQYLPWPHPPDPGLGARTIARDLRRGVYVGSLRGWKGAATLFQYFSHLLEAMPDFSVEIVGPTMDDVASNGLAGITARFGDRVRHTTHLGRGEARTLMAGALFVLSPGQKFGWGQIGDSWVSGTPVIAARQHYDLHDQENCLVAESPGNFLKAVQRLHEDEELRSTLITGGRRTAEQHSPEAVAAHLHTHLLRAL